MNHLLPCLKFFIVIFVLFILSIQYSFCKEAADNEKDIVIIKNLQNDLLIYDKGLQNYSPLIPNVALEIPTISYFLDLKLYGGFKIQHCVPKGSSIFMNQKIVDFIEVNDCKFYSIDSLKQVFQKDTLFITIYNASLKSKDIQVSVVSDKIIIDNKPENVAGFLSIISRDFSDFNDFFIIGVIIILILIAILYNGNPKYFQEFYSLPKAISLKIREESYLSVKNISGAYLLFLFVHSFLVSFVALTIINYHKGFQQLFYFINTSGIWNASLSWLQLSMIFFALFLAKYLFVKAISLLFNIKGFSTIHFFDFIRMSIIFFLLVLIVLCVFIFSSGSDEYIWFEPLINSIIIFFIFRVFVLFFKLYKYALLEICIYFCTFAARNYYP